VIKEMIYYHTVKTVEESAVMRGSAYSQDLRDRVIDAVEIEGLGCREAGRRFKVSASSAIKWVQRYRKLGQRHRGCNGHRPSKTKPHREWLLKVLESEPDITLSALSLRFLEECGIKADTSMLSRFFTAEGISFKKKRSAIRAGSSRRQEKAGYLEKTSA
jgi:transposase